MKDQRFQGYLLVFVFSVSLPAQNMTLTLGNATGAFGGPVDVPLSLSSMIPIQGVQAVFDWDGSAGTGVELVVNETIAGTAEFLLSHIDANWMTVGIISVEFPLNGEDIPVANARIQCGAGPAATATPVVFRDEVHGVSGSPVILSNTVTVGGASVTQVDGLALGNGNFVCLARPCPIENLVCTRAGAAIGLAWSIAQDPSCRCGSIRVREANTGAVIQTLLADATAVEIPCASLPGAGTLCVVCIGPDGSETQACCDYACAVFRRGDANDDGILDISDPVTVLSCIFEGIVCPTCLDAADCNDDGVIDTSDAVCSLGCVFGSGSCPGAPFPGCGVDPTADDPLGCAEYSSC